MTEEGTSAVSFCYLELFVLSVNTDCANPGFEEPNKSDFCYRV